MLPLLSLLSTWTIKILSTSFHTQFLQTTLNITVCQEGLPFLSYSPCGRKKKKKSDKFPEPFSLQLSAAHSSVRSSCCEQRWKHHTSKDSPRTQTWAWHMVLWPTEEDQITASSSVLPEPGWIKWDFCLSTAAATRGTKCSRRQIMQPSLHNVGP